MTTQKRLVSAMLLCAVGVAIAGLQCGLTVRQYTVQTDKIGKGKHLRIVMLSAQLYLRHGSIAAASQGCRAAAGYHPAVR